MVSKFVTYSGRTLYYGLTDDVKPIDAPNGACYTDIETGDEYWFDKENDGWYAPDGSFIPNPHEDEEGDEEVMFVNFSVALGVPTPDTSYADIVAAITAGKYVVGCVSFPDDLVHGDTVWWLPLTQSTLEGEQPGIVFETTVFDFASQGILHVGIMMGEESCAFMNAPLQIGSTDIGE